MQYLPLLLGLLAAVLINFLAGMISVLTAFLAFGIGGSAAIDGYIWLTWVFHLGLALVGLYGFSKFERRYGGQRFWFWAIVFVLELCGVSIMSLGVWIGDLMS